MRFLLSSKSYQMHSRPHPSTGSFQMKTPGVYFTLSMSLVSGQGFAFLKRLSAHCLILTRTVLHLSFTEVGGSPLPVRVVQRGRKRTCMFNVGRGRKGATEDSFKWDIQPNLICMAEERGGEMRSRKRRDRRIEYGLEGWIFYYFAPFCWSPCCSSVLELKYIDVAERSVSVAHVVRGRCVGVPLEPWIMGTAQYSSTSLRPEANLQPVFQVHGSGLEQWMPMS